MLGPVPVSDFSPRWPAALKRPLALRSSESNVPEAHIPARCPAKAEGIEKAREVGKSKGRNRAERREEGRRDRPRGLLGKAGEGVFGLEMTEGREVRGRVRVVWRRSWRGWVYARRQMPAWTVSRPVAAGCKKQRDGRVERRCRNKREAEKHEAAQRARPSRKRRQRGRARRERGWQAPSSWMKPGRERRRSALRARARVHAS